MANIRCPMCSKVNPPEAEMCGSCGARLKPVRPTSTPAASASQNDDPDWLRGLSQGAPSQPTGAQTGQPPAAKSSDSADVPGWLSRIRGKAHDEIGGDESSSASASEEEPDWMKGLQNDQEQASSDSGLENDWLDRLQGESSQPGADSSSPFAAPPTPPAGKPSSSTQMPPFDDQTGGTPDWMRSLSEDISSTSGDEPLIDWLSASSDAPTFDVSAPGGSPQVQGVDKTDWMNKLTWNAVPGTGESQPDQPAASGQEADPGSDDWFSKLNLGSQTDAGQPDYSTGGAASASSFGLEGFLSGKGQQGNEPAAPAQPPAGDDFPQPEQDKGSSSGFGMTAFLKNLEQRQSGESQPPAPSEPESGSFTDWGQSFGEPESSTTPSAPSGDTSSSRMLDWLSGESTSEPWEASTPSGDASPSAFGDFSFSAEPTSAETPTPAGDERVDDFSNWFQTMDSATDQPAAETGSQPGAADEGLPGWLSGTPAEPPAASSHTPAASDLGGMPSWLSGSEPAEPTSPPTAAQPAAQSENSELPNWLAGFNEPSQTEPSKASAADNFSAMPSWMDEGQEQTLPPFQAAESTPASAAAPGDVPDWLSSLAPSDEPSEAATPGFYDSNFGTASFSGDLLSATGEEEQPAAQAPSRDWLSSLQQPSSQATESAEAAGVPDWLRDFDAQPSSSGQSQISPLLGEVPSAGTPTGQPFDVDLPDWLSEEVPLKSSETSEQTAEMTSDNLAQADLPDWVQKMRPIESVIMGDSLSSETDQHIEKAGPLAGLRGVLPAEEMVARYRKPPTYSVKLRVTEKQRTQSALLDNLLAQESQPLLIQAERSQAPRVLLRLLTAVLLLVVLTAPILLGIQPLSRPVLAPNDLLNMFEKLDSSLQQDTPVLLAVDFEPALAGEMNLTAASVIDHLMSKNARIVMVSTVTSGPALAERLINDAALRRGSDYNLAEQTVNLGYLPGGTISLLEFAQQPQLAAPVTLAGKPAWSQPALQGITKLADFSQVIVITDTAETGRAWIEQVQPSMGSMPLFMVVSAQAAPMILPYVESKQVSGMVSGVMGGVMYGWKAGQTANPANDYFTAYQIGILLALLLALAGGLYSGVMSLVKRKDKVKDTDEA